MKRIGMLTFHRAINNGAVLQAYALARAFNSMECDAKYIDYTAERITKDYYITPLFKRRSIKSIGVYFLFDLNIAATHEKFHNFVNTNIPIGECDQNDIKTICNNYDAFVSGGDQIWNLNLTGHDTKYYLDFIDSTEKYSYGTSFGTTVFSDNDKELIKTCLGKYKQLNVREDSAKLFIESIVNCECNVVPDPVFLLSRTDWIQQLNLTESLCKRKYILFFELHENKKMREQALLLAKEKHCKIVRITNDFFRLPGMKNVKRTGPLEFLNYILNAEVVVTDSFHAAAFSLIFNRPLYIGLKEGEFAYLNTRIESLVNTYKIYDQIISNRFRESDIDYNEVNRILLKEQKRGITILEGIVNNIQNENK